MHVDPMNGETMAADLHAAMTRLEQTLEDVLYVKDMRIGLLETELGEAKDWVADLLAGTYVNCVYCGHRYGPDDEVPVAMADVLKEHIEQCPKHPLSAAKRELGEAREALRPFIAHAEKARMASYWSTSVSFAEFDRARAALAPQAGGGD